MRSPTIAPIAALAIALAAAEARPDTVNLSALKDNTLYESTSGALSNGAGEFLFAGATGIPSIRRGLIAFDLGAIPAGSTITSATLMLHMSRSNSGDVTVGLHRALADWGEGTSDATGEEGGGTSATPGDATWLHTFSPSSFWTNPGGDFNATASATQTVGAIGNYAWSSPGLVADLQAWLDSPSLNFGWLIRGDESAAGSAKRFDSRQNATVAFRPLLTVEFTPVPEPSSLALLALGAAGWLGVRLRRRTHGRRT